jgi:hypothetical protein
MQVSSQGSELEGAVAIAKETKVCRVANPLARNGLEFFDNFLGPVGRAVIEHNEAVRAKGLAGHGLEGLPDEPLAVVDGNSCDEVKLHPVSG